MSVALRRAAVLSCLISACVSSGPPAPLLEYVESSPVTDPNVSLPLLVALHGRGGQPETFIRNFATLSIDARVIALRAPIEENTGRAWFTFQPNVSSARAQMRALVPRVVATITRYQAEHATRGRPVVVGFSQGAILIYELVTLAPRSFAAAFPVSGVQLELPAALPEPLPPIHAFHGVRDEVIAIGSDEATVSRLRALGAKIEMNRFGAATHWIDPEMRDALVLQLSAALKAQR
jgi:predicted esterase